MLNLDVLPNLDLEVAAEDRDNGIVAALEAKRHVWWINDEADRCLPFTPVVTPEA